MVVLVVEGVADPRRGGSRAEEFPERDEKLLGLA